MVQEGGKPSRDSCLVCRAPALPEIQSCPFCRAPHRGEGDPSRLLEYLAIRLPGVAISHSLIHRRAISELRVTVGSEAYKLRWRRKRLESCPDLGLPLWIERLLSSLTAAAGQDYELRQVLSRNGWAWRYELEREA